MNHRQGGVLAVMVAAVMVASGCSSSTSSSGRSTTSVNPCVHITPLPTAATPSPDVDQLACLIGSVTHDISVATDESKSGQLTLDHWQDCQKELIMWKEWSKGHDDLWFSDHQLKRYYGDCGPKPKR